MLPLSVHPTAPVLHAVACVVKSFGENVVVPKIVSMLMKVTLSLELCLDDIVCDRLC
jgi:hypothetical protein